MPVSLIADALCTLDELKGYKDKTGNITTRDDDVNRRLINSASTILINRFSRHFVAQQFYEYANAPFNRPFRLREYPILRLDGIWRSRNTAFTAYYTSSTAISAGITVLSDKLTAWSVAQDGTQTDNDFDYDDYASVYALVAGIDALSGWTATLTANAEYWRLWPESYGCLSPTTASVQYAGERLQVRPDNARIGLVSVSKDPTSIPLSSSAYGQSLGSVPAIVSYRAGYETIPDDLKQACIQLAIELDQPYGAAQDRSANGEMLTAGMIKILQNVQHYERRGV